MSAPKLTPVELRAVELVDTEESYVEGIRNLYENFYLQLKAYSTLGQAIISDEEVTKIFMNLQAIYNANKMLLGDMQQLRYRGNDVLISNIGNLMSNYTPYLKIYVEYVAQYPVALDVLLKLAKKKNWLEFLELNQKIAKSDIQSLLILPVQRVPRYVMLLDELSSFISDDQERKELEASMAGLKEVAAHINTQVKNLEARKKVVQMQEKLFRNTIMLVSPTRYHVLQGELKKVFNKGNKFRKSTKRYVFILFNDILIYCTPQSHIGDSVYKFKHALPLASTSCEKVSNKTVSACKKGEYAFSIDNTGGAKSFICIAPDKKTRTEWIEKITEYATQSRHFFSTIKKMPPRVEEIEETILKSEALEEFRDDDSKLIDTEKFIRNPYSSHRRTRSSQTPNEVFRNHSLSPPGTPLAGGRKARTYSDVSDTASDCSDASDFYSTEPVPHSAPPPPPHIGAVSENHALQSPNGAPPAFDHHTTSTLSHHAHFSSTDIEVKRNSSFRNLGIDLLRNASAGSGAHRQLPPPPKLSSLSFAESSDPKLSTQKRHPSPLPSSIDTGYAIAESMDL